MAREDTRNCHDFTKMIIGLLSFTLTIHVAVSQKVRVDPEVMSYPGQPVNLRCSFPDGGGIQLTQVSWIYEPKEGERMNIAVFHPNFGANYPPSPQKGRVAFTSDPPTLVNPSIQITDVKMSDEGKYICEYATYPSGNEQGITSLVMLAKPRNSASPVTVPTEAKAVVVARCESVDGRPAAQISWVTSVNGNGTSVSKPGLDNTVTVTSEYWMVPTPAANGKDISCVVSHRTQPKPESFQMKLAIEYPPQVSILGYDNNWYVGRTNVVLTCQATGNPIPTLVTWKTLTGEMPETVTVSENRLTVLKVDESVNGTFVCEVKNRLGLGKDQVTALVRGTRLPAKGPTTGSIIGGIIAVILILAITGTAIAMYRKHRASQLNGDEPPNYKPPPPNKTTSSSADRLNTSRDPVSEDRPLQQQNYISQNAEPVTDLDAYYGDEEEEEANDGEHYYATAPSGWDDPGQGEVPPPYTYRANEHHEQPTASGVSRGDSFMSPAMFV